MLGLAQARTSLRRSAGDCARVASRSGASSSGSSSAPRLSQVQLRAHTRAAAAARRALATTATASKASAPAAAPLHRTRAQLSDLPDKVLVRTGPLGRLSKVLSPRISASITTRVGSSFGGNHSLEWQSAPRNILVVQKRDAKASEAAVRIAEHLAKEQPQMNVIVEAQTFAELHARLPNLVLVRPEERKLLADKVDMVLTLGGDGTILHASSLFDDAAVPPVLSFSMGTLGFLLPYHIDSFADALRDIFAGSASLLLRMRLHLTKHAADGTLLPTADGRLGDVHLMNEVTLHRGREPHLTMIDAFVDGRHLTQAISDGLIVATPTGSTAYSLSAGGPIVHPSVQNLILTPICPRSLSFRTVLLPSDSTVQLKISRTSRAAAELTVDGRDMGLLRPGEFLQVGMSPFPIPCVNRSTPTSALSPRPEPPLLEGGGAQGVVHRSERGEDDWVRDINTLLKFNTSFGKLPNE